MKMKKRQYEQRVREIEHSSFSPIVLSTSGGMAKQATLFYKRLATLLATKRDISYNRTVNLIRCHISFSMLGQLYNVFEEVGQVFIVQIWMLLLI